MLAQKDREARVSLSRRALRFCFTILFLFVSSRSFPIENKSNHEEKFQYIGSGLNNFYGIPVLHGLNVLSAD